MRRFLAVLAFVLLPSLAHAQVPLAVAGTSLAPFQDLGDCQLTSISAATLLSACTGGVPKFTQYAIITVEGNSYRWRADGTAPTATVGQLVTVSSTQTPQMIYTTNLITSLQIIPITGSITIDVSFFGIK